MSLPKKIVRTVLSILPKNPHKVIFESHSDFCDNSRALYEYLVREQRFKDICAVWCVKSPEAFDNFPKKGKYPIFINPRSKKGILRWLFHVGTAKTVFYSHIKPPLCDTKRQTVVCLWHGIPLKKIALYEDTPEEAFTHLPTSGRFYSEVMMNCFKAKPSQLVSTGFPRNDLLFDGLAGDNALKSLGIDKARYKGGIIAWMPTFRQHKESGYADTAVTDTGLPLLTSSDLLLLLEHELERNNQLMLLKLHPVQDISLIKMESFSNLRLISNKDLDKANVQLYHLLAGCSALLTDYSSVYFDYLLLNRPIGFIVDDMQEYLANRGFVTENPLALMPGAKLSTAEELLSWLARISAGDDGFEAERLELLPRLYDMPDGDACERVAALI